MSRNGNLNRLQVYLRRQHNQPINNNQFPPHETDGNKSEKRSVFINTILAGLTIIAIIITWQANKTSQQALAHAIINDRARDSTDSIKDDENRDFIKRTLELSKGSLDAQKKSIEETQRQFEKINDAYAQAEEFMIDYNEYENKLYIRYMFFNKGNQPAKIISKISYIQANKSSFFGNTVPNLEFLVGKAAYQSDNTYFTKDGVSSTGESKIGIIHYNNFKSGGENIFFYIRAKYQNLVNKNFKTYKCLVEIFNKNGQIGFIYHKNDNYPFQKKGSK